MLKPILPENVETFSLVTSPLRTFTSSSSEGITGQVYPFSHRSTRFKDSNTFVSGNFNDTSLVHDVLKNVKLASDTNGNCSGEITEYMNLVSSLPSASRNDFFVEARRHGFGPDLDSEFLKKAVILSTLYPYYRSCFDTSNTSYSYKNFLSLNFTDTEPSDSVLLYPNQTTELSNNVISGAYVPSGAFSFNFWIKPTYTTTNYKAGTLLHLSSCFAVSLITGSASQNGNGESTSYRVLLQLSSSADILPSLISTSSLPEFCFLSLDNEDLKQHYWNNVTLRWGTSTYNNGTGSIVLNGNVQTNFVVPSASVIPTSFLPGKANPDVLCVGNYYEGENSGSNALAYFFSTDTHEREGLAELVVDSGFAPSAYSFTHPLNAEISDLTIYGSYLSNQSIQSILSGTVPTDSLLFRLPPFFTYESPTRKRYGGFGGIFTTPFTSKTGTTTKPFSAELSFGVGGHYINLENHLREFVQGAYPRTWNLSGSILTGDSVEFATSDAIMYATASVRKRSQFILPNDNGLATPDLSCLLTLSQSSFLDLNPENVSLFDIVPSSSIRRRIRNMDSGSIGYSLAGPTPDNSSSFLSTGDGETYTILQRTQDTSSNQAILFDVSNLFYGSLVTPLSFSLYDSSLSGSEGRTPILLKDNGLGTLYRANTSSSVATWNGVGNLFYPEGLSLIKSPYLYFFGKDSFELSLRGEQTIHVLKFNLYANPYENVTSTNTTHNTGSDFVYVSTINIHDDNMNVIMKTNLAQPVTLRTGEKLLFKTKLDF